MEVSSYISAKIKFFSLLCAGMVVGIHVSGIEEQWSVMWWWSRIGHYGIFLIAVPFFFVSSGYFISGHFNEDGWWLREVRKRCKSLFVPFVIWSVVAVLLMVGKSFCANVLYGRDLLSNIPNDFNFWLKAFGLYPFAYPELVPLWFIRSLMIFVFISPLLYYLERWGIRMLVTIYFLHFIIMAFGCGKFYLFMRYTFSLYSLSFFFMGMILRVRGMSVVVNNKGIAIIALLVGVVMLGVSLFIYDAESKLFWMCRMIFVPLFLFAIWNLMPAMKLPHCFSSVSFQIFLLHVIVWSVLDGIANISGINFSRPGCLFLWWMKWGIGFVIPIAFSALLCRVFPRINRVLFGGR